MVTKAEILTRINDARVEARQDTARKMLEDNEPIEKICRYTDLDQADVLTLQKEMTRKKPASRLARV